MVIGNRSNSHAQVNIHQSNELINVKAIKNIGWCDRVNSVEDGFVACNRLICSVSKIYQRLTAIRALSFWSWLKTIIELIFNV